MVDELLPPDAELFESMRSIGYSLKTAIADIVDNSISAKAKSIEISFAAGKRSYVAICDDGTGMSVEDLRMAMKLAGKSPKSIRGDIDLGRFGLGLKTASLSQCRRLTVLTKQLGGNVSCAQWDLDYVAKRGDWVLRWLELPDYPELDIVEEFQGGGQGTLVIWEDLDQLLEGDAIDESTLGIKFSEVREHLSLVFHRFMAATNQMKVSVSINGQTLEPYDPFLVGSAGVQKKPVQKIKIAGHQVTVTPYILPNQNKMNAEQRKKALFGESLERTAGFYVYRNGRLLIHGTWFRLSTRTPLSKLARVQVDFPPILDSEWKLGIMKSSVQPPIALRRALSNLVPRIVGESASVAKGMSKASVLDSRGIWRVRELGDGQCSIEIDMDYPMITALSNSLSATDERKFEAVLRLIESQFPVNILFSRMTADYSVDQSTNQLETKQFAIEFVGSMLSAGISEDLAFNALLNVEPFSDNPQLAKQIQDIKEQIIKGAKP